MKLYIVPADSEHPWQFEADSPEQAAQRYWDENPDFAADFDDVQVVEVEPAPMAQYIADGMASSFEWNFEPDTDWHGDWENPPHKLGRERPELEKDLAALLKDAIDKFIAMHPDAINEFMAPVGERVKVRRPATPKETPDE